MRLVAKTLAGAALLAMASGTEARAGAIFLTGHDPDVHTQSGNGTNLLKAGLSFVTSATYNDSDPNTKPFLWVEARPQDVPSGHLRGEDSLIQIGLTLGVQYDRANAGELGSVDLSKYSAIAIASSFGGLLGRAELDALIARKTDIANFVNSGGGLFASAECFPCGADLLAGATSPLLFGFVPVTVTSIGADPPFTVTPFGAAAPFNLTFNDLNDPTHNSFGLVGGLGIVDTDDAGHATTLAGVVGITDTGFVPTVPEPGTLALLGGSLLGLGWMRRRRN